jgi:hypothetical protein
LTKADAAAMPGSGLMRDRGVSMRACVGDRLVIASNTLDRPVRDGRIVELRHPDGSPPYMVQWSDSPIPVLVFPGPDAHVQHAEASVEPAVEPTRRVRTWRVEVHLFETGAETTAHAVLASDAPHPLEARGRAHRRVDDVPVPEVGDEIAVGRALHRLGDVLISAAEGDLSAVYGRRVPIQG